MAFRAQPRDQLHQIFLRHRRAASGWPVHAAPNMKKNRASRAGHRWIGIVADLNEPLIREIAGAHFFVRVIVRRIFWIDHDVTVVIGRTRIIAPNVCLGYLMILIITAGRQARSISKHLPDFENSCRCAAISLFLSKTRLVLSGQSCAPGDPVFAKQHWERSSYWSPIATARSFKESYLSTHRIPSRRDTEDELRAIIGNTLGICTDANHHRQTNREAADDRHKHFQNWTGVQVVPAVSTAAVSAGRYFTPTSQARPERKMIPDTNRNATCMLA